MGKQNLWFVAIVVIVAVVGIVLMVSYGGGKAASVGEGDLAGQAYTVGDCRELQGTCNFLNAERFKDCRLYTSMAHKSISCEQVCMEFFFGKPFCVGAYEFSEMDVVINPAQTKVWVPVGCGYVVDQANPIKCMCC